MHIKLTEYVRATTLTLNIKDAPRQTSLLIHDAFAKLVADLEQHIEAEAAVFFGKLGVTAGDVMQPVKSDVIVVNSEVQEQARQLLEAIEAVGYQYDEAPTPEQPARRRGRPPKVKVEEPAPAVEPTPLEQAIAKAEDEQSQGETPAPAAESLEAPLNGADTALNTESSHTSAAPESESPTTPATPVSDFDMNSYLAKVCNQSKGAAYKETIYELAKPFVEEGAVPRPSNIKGDDKRWQFIKAVETDSGVKYHG